MASGMAFHAGNSLNSGQRLALRLAQNEVLAMCELLEDIADSLPHHIDAKKCSRAAELLEPLIKRVHRFEEDEIYSAYAGPEPSKGLQKTIERLRAEHLEDECHAEELSDALRKISSSADSVSSETLGYMLRGFFEAIRRQVAFEREQFSPETDLN
jgi:hemerythrin-like domain-containing protein